MLDPESRCHLLGQLALAVMRCDALRIKDRSSGIRQIHPVDLITRDGEDFLVLDNGEALPVTDLRLAPD